MAMDPDSKRPEGIFAAAYRLLDGDELEMEEWRQLRELMNWFNENLPHPPESFAASRAVFWFRAGAEECIGRVWELVAVLREHGIHVLIHKCEHLANPCYGDALQVAAYPSAGDGRITVQ